MLSNNIEKVKNWYKDARNDIYVAVLIFFVGLASFGLGRLSILWQKKEPIQITNQESGIMNYENKMQNSSRADIPNSKIIIPNSRGKYVGSKSGTTYHAPWCPGALKIKEENKIWFQSKEEAVIRGYKPAGNCPGI